jgi:hypothetical protein
MTTPMLMTEHLTEETLAAYIDDRLDSATREPVTQHLASCGECREIVLMTTAYQVDEESAKVTRGNFGGSWSMAAMVGVAAAAAIVVIAVQSNSFFFKDLFEKVRQASVQTWVLTKNAVTPGTDVDDLRGALRSQPKRVSLGRLAGFPYQQKPDGAKRGGEDNEGDVDLSNVELLNIAADLEADLEKGKSPDPHVVGLATLLIGKDGKAFADAVTKLEGAHQKARGAERDSIAIDLAAALIAKAGWSGDDAAYRRALELSNDVLKRKPESPEALWNRAIAIEAISAKDMALRAWDDYLKVDSKSQWAQEASARKTVLQSDFIGP